MKKKILSLCMALIVLVALSACGTPAPAPAPGTPEPAAETQLIIAVNPDYESFDPAITYEAYGMLILHPVYDTLLEFDRSLDNLVKSLAQDYTVSDDGLIYTVTLKSGLNFASGNPLTSADVKWSIERAINIKGNAAFMAEKLVSIETPDDTTVVFTLSEPDPSFPVKLTYNFFSVLDSKLAQEHGATNAEDAATSDTAKTWLDSNSAGSGPYIIDSYTPKVEVVLVRNPNYWGTPAYYDKVTVSTIADSNSQSMMLQAGDIDIAFNLGPEQIAPLAANSAITVMERQTLTESFLLMNRSADVGGPVADPKVQKAIRLALDYPGIQSIAGTNMSTPVAPFPIGLIGSLLPIDPSGYPQVDAAKALMAEAGYGDGFSTKLYVPTTNIIGVDFLTLAQKIQNDLAVIGITTELVPEDIMISLATYRDGQQSLGLWYWNPDYPDNNSQLAFMPGQTVGLRANWTAESAPELAALTAAAAKEANEAQRLELFKQIQESMIDDSPFAMLLQHSGQYATRTGLKGADYIDRYYLDIKKISE